MLFGEMGVYGTTTEDWDDATLSGRFFSVL